MLAMLVHNVASTLQMICRRTRVNATRAAPADLPQAKTDTQSRETRPAANPSSPKALILRDRRHTVRTAEIHRAIVSKDEGVLTTLSPSFLRSRVSDGAEGAIWSSGPNRGANAEGPRSHAHNACRPWLPALRYAPAGMTNIEGHVGCIEDAPLEADPWSAFPAQAGIQTHIQKNAREAHKIPSQLFWTPAYAGDADR